ncbi:UNVERIFIED_CONTAM: hypothetical protein RMT77_007807 [Armadillidium vulgare]
MMKVKKYPKVIQNYRKFWETLPEFRGWLTEIRGDSHHAYCTWCKKILNAHKRTLIDHKRSSRHSLAERGHRTCTEEQFSITMPPPFVLPTDIKQVEEINLPHPEIDSGIEIEYADSNMENFSSLHDSVAYGILPDFSDEKLPTHTTVKSSTLPLPPRHKNVKKCISRGVTYINLYPDKDPLSSSQPEHELDSFAKSIAAQMKNLPESETVKLTLEIQNLVTKARVRVLEEQKMNKKSLDDNPKLITVSYENPTSTIQEYHVNSIQNLHL